MPGLVDFDEVDVGPALDALSDLERDALDYGVVKLDRTGVVSYYSKTEARQSGFRKPAIGKDFFLEVAPCMNKPEFKGRLVEAWRKGKVDIEIGWVGDFSDADRELRIRVASASDGGVWILLNRDEDD